MELKENLRLQEFSVESNNPDKLLELDYQFHEKIFAHCKRTQVYNLMQSMTIHFDRVRTLRVIVVKDYEIVKNHKDILEAVERKDKELAKTLMRKHLHRYKTDDRGVQELYPQYFRK